MAVATLSVNAFRDRIGIIQTDVHVHNVLVGWIRTIRPHASITAVDFASARFSSVTATEAEVVQVEKVHVVRVLSVA